MDNLIEVSNCRWKYLRECEGKYFNAAKNTTLSEYLEYMFKGCAFVYNQRIPKDLIKHRDPDAAIKLYRPDARCEALSLIVEFDGVAHYQDQLVVMQDEIKDQYLHKLGYVVVRIPYWIQLSRPVIHHLFRNVSQYLTLSEDDKMCELPYSFYDPKTQDPGLNISIGSMCEAGRYRFLREVCNMPVDIQTQVYWDIYECCAHVPDTLYDAEYIIPSYIMQKWGIEQFPRELDAIEYELFNRPFAYTNYLPMMFCMFEWPYDKYIDSQKSDSIVCPSINDAHVSDEFVSDVLKVLRSLNSISNVIDLNVTGVALHPLRDDYGVFITGFNAVCDNEIDLSFIYEFITKHKEMIEYEISADHLLIYVWW